MNAFIVLRTNNLWHDVQRKEKMSVANEDPHGKVFKVLERHPRVYNSALPIRSFGWEPQKSSRMNREWSFVSFSLISNGSGRLTWNNRDWDIKGPCLVIQWPQQHYDYAPHTYWDEFYLTYSANHVEAFHAESWAPLKNQSVFQLQDWAPIHVLRNQILKLVPHLGPLGVADRIDLLGQEIVLLAWDQARRQDWAPKEEDRLYAIKKYIEDHFHEAINFDEIAKAHYFSPRGFWRHWQKVAGGTPGEYLTLLRMQRACELLACTDYTVRNIAREVGYSDQLYFSRRFHLEMGCTPTNYRQLNKPSVKLE